MRDLSYLITLNCQEMRKISKERVLGKFSFFSFDIHLCCLIICIYSVSICTDCVCVCVCAYVQPILGTGVCVYGEGVSRRGSVCVCLVWYGGVCVVCCAFRVKYI